MERGPAETAGPQHQRQGFATGEIIPIAMIHFWHRIADTQIVMVNTVHDSLVSELPPEEQERFEKIAVQAMTYDVKRFLEEIYGYNFITPLGVGVKVAEHWGDTKRERTFNVFPDGHFTVKEKN